MFKLGNIGVLGVAQRWVGIHDANITQILEGHLVLGLSQPVKIPARQNQSTVLGLLHRLHSCGLVPPCVKGRNSTRRCLPLAKCQCAKISIDDIEQGLGSGKSQRHMADVKILHVMAALQVFMHISLACVAVDS